MGTQVLAAFMDAYGWLVSPISWGFIGFVWVYNLVWLGVIDIVKIALFRWHDMRETRQTNWQKWLYTPLDSLGGRLGKLSKAA